MPPVHHQKLTLARTHERHRLDFLVQRDGVPGALDFARRTLLIYQTALRYKGEDPGKPRHHFSRSVEYVDGFVGSILELKAFIRAHALTAP